jgi:hypothetical protein
LHSRSPSPAPGQAAGQASTGVAVVPAAAGSTRAGGGTRSAQPSPSPQPSALRQAGHSHARALHSGTAAVQPSRAAASTPSRVPVQAGFAGVAETGTTAAAVHAQVQWWGAPVAAPPGAAAPSSRKYYEVRPGWAGGRRQHFYVQAAVVSLVLVYLHCVVVCNKTDFVMQWCLGHDPHYDDHTFVSSRASCVSLLYRAASSMAKWYMSGTT